jgi:hypothetical protein
MEFALGVLKWTPDRFWASTFYEVSCAYVGHNKSAGTGRWARRPDGWTEDEISAHLEEIADMKRRFPDEPVKGKRKRKNGHRN